MINEIDRLIRNYLEEEGETFEENFSGRVNDNTIIAAQEALKITFPDEYKYFLKNYGSGGIAGIVILGIESEKYDTEMFSVVSETKIFRKEYNFKYSYLVIESEGGYVTCLDTETNKILLCEPTENGEIIDKNVTFSEYIIDKIKYMIE